MSTIIVAVQEDITDVGHLVKSLGLDAASAKMITTGSIQVSAVDYWVGVDPVTEGWVNLVAPIPKPGDVPRTWMYFDGGMVANTSDLAAIRLD